jgi:hypothetical protein
MLIDNENKRVLTPEEVEIIKKQLIDSILADMSRSVIKKFMWVVVVFILIVVAFLTGSGHIKL